MNNYGNPYYMGVGQQPYNYSNFQPYQNTNMAQVPNNMSNQQFIKQTTYDFQGNYVKSYEEAKNSPYTDKTMVYIDTENDRIYIKRINEKGTPQTDVYNISQAKDEKKNIDKEKQFDLENKFNLVLSNLKEEYDNKISVLEKQIKELKESKTSTSTKGGK